MIETKNGNKTELIVSLTTYPARIGCVNKTIETLLEQTYKADKTILWLAEEQFPQKEKNLPQNLVDLKNKGLTISWCDDIKSYKKLVPALEQYPKAIIVTADDDFYYDKNWLELLVKDYLKNKDSGKYIYCHRITKFYKEKMGGWKTIPAGRSVYPEATYLHKLAGGAGSLYPPHCLYKDVTDREKFLKLAPTSDDIWFWFMAILNGNKIKVIDGAIPEPEKVEGSQNNGALYLINDGGLSVFWNAFNSLIEEYPEANRILNDEYKIMSKKDEQQNRISINKKKADFYYKMCIDVMRGLQGEERLDFVRLLSEDFRLKIESGIWEQEYFEDKDWANISKIISSPEEYYCLDTYIDYEFWRTLSPKDYSQSLNKWLEDRVHYKTDIENPKTFDEKIQWLKLYENLPIKSQLADKYLVREYVKEKIGEEYLIPLLGVWDKFDEIDFDKLPNQFVLKGNHGCGYNLIVTDKQALDIDEAREKFSLWMQTDFSCRNGLELHYSDIERKIIAEEYCVNDGNELNDYKIYCFGGKPTYIQYLTDRKSQLKMAFYDLDWKKLPFYNEHSPYEGEVDPPKNLKQMLDFSEKLATGFIFARVDFYILNDGSIKFGEITFTPASGGMVWEPAEYDRILGDMITLPKEKTPLPEKSLADRGVKTLPIISNSFILNAKQKSEEKIKAISLDLNNAKSNISNQQKELNASRYREKMLFYERNLGREERKKITQECNDLKTELGTVRQTAEKYAADKDELNLRLQKAYEEKSKINATLQKTYTEKSEINAKLQRTYAEKSEINAKLQKTYAEKSEINAKLQQTYEEKRQRGIEIKNLNDTVNLQQQQIELLRKEISDIKGSKRYKIGKAIVSPWVAIRKLFNKNK